MSHQFKSLDLDPEAWKHLYRLWLRIHWKGYNPQLVVKWSVVMMKKLFSGVPVNLKGISYKEPEYVPAKVRTVK